MLHGSKRRFKVKINLQKIDVSGRDYFRKNGDNLPNFYCFLDEYFIEIHDLILRTFAMIDDFSL